MHFDLKDVEVVIDVARQAGELVRRMQEAGLRNIKSKTSAGDSATEADVASERLIRDALAQRYPSVGLWGEESNTMPGTEYFWLVDPIDGTTNYAFGLDYNAVNIALQHREQTLLGVTYQYPHRPCLLQPGRRGRHPAGCRRGRDAPAGQRRRRTAPRPGRYRFPLSQRYIRRQQHGRLARITTLSGSVRCLGAAALDLAHVAGGAVGLLGRLAQRLDAAPGVLFVRGGRRRCHRLRRRRVDDCAGPLVSSNGQPGVHDALLAAIQEARAGLPESNVADAVNPWLRCMVKRPNSNRGCKLCICAGSVYCTKCND